MSKKVMVVFGVISGLIITLGVTGFIILARNSNPVLAVMLKRNPYDKGYRCTGTGDISFYLNVDKLRKIPGFPEGDAGQLLTSIVVKNIKSMSMKIDYQGTGKGGESLTVLKLSSEGLPEYISSYYTDGTKKWVKISGEGREDKWNELTTPAGMESIISSFDMEELEDYKDLFALTAQDENSSTFLIKVTPEILGPLFGAEGKKTMETLAGDIGLSEFLNSMNMIMEMKTVSKVNFFSPYVGLSNVKLSFTLPFEKMSMLMGDEDMKMLSPEERGVFQAVYINTAVNISFAYGDIYIEKPQM